MPPSLVSKEHALALHQDTITLWNRVESLAAELSSAGLSGDTQASALLLPASDAAEHLKRAHQRLRELRQLISGSLEPGD